MFESRRTILDNFYTNFYSKIHGVGVNKFGQNMLHAKLESYHNSTDSYPITVELGAGNQNHYRLVKHSFNYYFFLDYNSNLLLNQNDYSNNSLFILADAGYLPFRNKSIDRIIATCLLLHLDSPWDALISWKNALKPSGIIDLVIVIEESYLLNLYRFFFSKRKSKLLGFHDFDLVNHLDHKNRLKSLLYFISQIFSDKKVSFQYNPFPWLPYQKFNSYIICRISPKN